MLASNTILQNRYRVIRELGHGGMGTVYEALDQRVNCIVALKETSAVSDGETRSAFEREAALLGNLRHSALPKVMDYFSEDNGDFLVMEFIPGYDLAELLELRGGPFPQTQVMRWANDLLRVLDYLHSQNPPILHRDIKPSNLKLTKQGEIFLLDFGLAKGAAGQMPTLMTSRSVRGYTPVYASLEQIHGHGTDARSDIYSLAATLYHLLTGVAPVDAPKRYSVLEDDHPDPLQPIEKLNAQVSANIATVIHRGMAINRRQRPATASEMRKALRSALEEDEQHASEEEYRRAEATRQQREEERRQAAAEAAQQQTEDERLHQEADTRRRKAQEREREEEAARLAEAKRRAEAEQQAREEAERVRAREEERRRVLERKHEEEEPRQHPDLLATTPAPTVRSREQSTSEPAKPQPSIETMKALLPERVDKDLIDNSRGIATARESSADTPTRNRAVMIVAVSLIGVVALGLTGWFVRGALNRNLISTEPSQPTQTQTDKLTPPTGMVYVPGGEFMMGRDNGVDEAERPAHQVKVKPFYIDVHEVTNDDYAKFVDATNHRPPLTWSNGSYQAGDGRKPTTGVTWDDANAYAEWAKKRLPTEEEWEFAARGADGRHYSWGNDWRQESANANGTGQAVEDVGSFKGASPFGAFDMIGNAWEWTASDFRAHPGGRLPANLPGGDLKVIRGGSYESPKEYATTTYRTGWPARGAKTYAQTGFRCARDITP